MASSKEYLDFILEQLSELEGISYRAMMGEYILYYGGYITRRSVSSRSRSSSSAYRSGPVWDR